MNERLLFCMNQTSLNRSFTTWSLLGFAAPSIIMMVFMSLYTIVDGIFISRFVGSNALSSLNIVYPMISVVIAIATMFATGAMRSSAGILVRDRKAGTEGADGICRDRRTDQYGVCGSGHSF